MDELFRLIRLPFLPVPLFLWTLIWILLLASTVVVVIPLGLLAFTVVGTIGFPFVFFGAAYSNSPENIKACLDWWRGAYETTMSLPNEIKIACGYQRLLAWGNDPKTVSDTDTGILIGTANVVAVLVIAGIFSEMVRSILMAVGGLIIIIIVFSILGAIFK